MWSTHTEKMRFKFGEREWAKQEEFSASETENENPIPLRKVSERFSSFSKEQQQRRRSFS